MRRLQAWMPRRRRLVLAVIGLVAALVAFVGAVSRDDHGGVRPVDAFQRSMDADPQHQSALRIRRVSVPDLVGQPLAAAQAFVDTVANAHLTVGGEGSVILFQQPSAGGLLSDDGAYLAVTLGSAEQLAAVRQPDSLEAKQARRAAGAAYPQPTTTGDRGTARKGSPSIHQVRDPDGVAVRPPMAYPTMVVVVTYSVAAPAGNEWTWKLVDTRTAAVVGAFAVRPGEGCSAPGRQRLAAALTAPARPDDEFTVRLDRRVGVQDEHVAASTLPAAATFRGQGVVLFENAGKLATNPTGDSRC